MIQDGLGPRAVLAVVTEAVEVLLLVQSCPTRILLSSFSTAPFMQQLEEKCWMS